MAKRVVGQPQVLKEVNIHIVENIIVEQGPITKPQIAKATGLSLPTVNKIVAQLEQNSVVKVCGVHGAGVGRKAMLYGADGHSGNLLALYISQNRCTCCVSNMADKIISRFMTDIDVSSGDSPCQSLYAAIDRLLDCCTAQPKAIGIGVPGLVDSSGVISSIPSIPQWEGKPLAAVVQEKYGIQTCTENNAKLTALGYYDSNLRGNYEDVVYLYLGQGISAGIILGSRLFKGHSSFSGELGYMLTREPENFRPEQGNLEAYWSRLVQSLSKTDNPDELCQLHAELVTCLSQVITNFICTINPQAVILRGNKANNDILKMIHQRVASCVPQHSMPELLIDRGELSGIYGITSVCRNLISPAYNIMKG